MASWITYITLISHYIRISWKKAGKVGNEANQLVIEIIDYVDICVDI